MANYEKMYKTLFMACEKAMNILEEAQKECEEMYIGGDKNLPRLKIFSSDMIEQIKKSQ